MHDGIFAGGAFDFFSLLGLVCGLGLVGGYALLGAGWLIWQTEGATQIFGREVGARRPDPHGRDDDCS